MRIFQKGFNFSQDGPGNRLVFHLQGCNMHCPWCSNPEGMSFRGGEEYTPEQIIQECIRSRAMFFGGGGVTFTGGEATMQSEELIVTLDGLVAAGIHTALETNGTSKSLPDIVNRVDYLIMDFKHFDKDRLRELTGADIDVIKLNYKHLCDLGRQLHIRIPLINHINADTPEGFAEYFSQFNTSNTFFEFLPYHEYGKGKWQKEYKISDGFINVEQLKRFKKVFEEYNLRVIST